MTSPLVIDSHTHLDTYAPEEREGIIARMAAANVRAISVGTHPEDWVEIVKIAELYPEQVCGYTFGTHPTEIKGDGAAQLAALEKMLSDYRPLAIGEVGLDFYQLEDNPDRLKIVELQRKIFAAQLAITKAAHLPLVIHSRGHGAFAEVVEAIDKSGFDWRRVVFHCFGESAERVRELNSRGGRASFTGVVTFKNAPKVREALAAQPKELLMVETDCPFMSPEPHRGETNEPANVVWVLKKAAELYNMEPSDLAPIVEKNTREFFGIK
jgi:TatD DNase family protein